MKTKWTYKIETIRPPVFAKSTTKAEFVTEVLNRRGLEGWELCQVVAPPTRSAVIWLYFKKPL